MAKALKAALIAAAIAGIVVLTGGAAFAASPFITGFGFAGLTGVNAFIAFSAVAAFATTGLSMMLAPDPPQVAQSNFGTKTSQRNANAPRQVVYGKTRIGGTVTQMESTGSDNHKLSMFIVLAGHEIESLEQVIINDVTATLGGGNVPTSTVSGETVHEINLANFINTDNANAFTNGRLIRFTFHDGSQTAHDGLARATLGAVAVPNTHKFTDCAYVYMELIYDPEHLGQVPQISFVVKGKNVFDPRTSAISNSDLQRSNPALIIRDFLMDTTYGLKATSDEINDTTNAGGFAAAANTCDQTVSLNGGGNERRYTCNGFTDMGADMHEFIQACLASMAGTLTYSNGKFNVFAGANQTASLTITDDDCLSDITVTKKNLTGGLFNTVKGIYTDASNKYIGTDAPIFQSSTFLTQDTPSGESSANYVKTMEVRLPFTTTSTMAQRLQKIALLHQRQTATFSGVFSLEFMKLQPKDYVNVTNTRLSFSSKLFEVISVSLDVAESDGTPFLGTRLELKEIDTAVYDFATNEYSTEIAAAAIQNVGTSALLGVTGANRAQTATKEGVQTKINILVTWTARNDPTIVNTEIQFKLDSESNYRSLTTGPKTTNANIPNVAVGETYQIRLRNVGKNGSVSAFTTLSDLTITAVSSAPNAPTNVSIRSGKSFQIGLSWTNPSDADLRAVKIYRKTNNTTPTDDTDLVETIYGEPSATSIFNFGVQDGLTAGTVYYFWLRAINHSGVHSSFTSSVNGSFTTVDDSTLEIPSGQAMKLKTFDAVSHVNAGTIGASLFGEKSKLDFSFNLTGFTNMNTNIANGTMIAILDNPITLTIPATKTAESKNYLASCSFGPIGKTLPLDIYNTIVVCGIAVSTSSSPTATGSFIDSDSRIHIGDGLSVTMQTLNLGFSVTTSTSSQVQRFVHVYGYTAALYGTSYNGTTSTNGTNAKDSGDLGFVVSATLQGVHR